MANSFAVDGLISGMRTSDIIEQMMSLERRPLTALQSQKARLQQRADAMRDVNTRLSALKTMISKLTLQSTLNAKTATTDTPSTATQILAATANSDAALGSFKVTVDRLATATAVKSTGALANSVDETATLANAGFGLTPSIGTFTINGATITIDENTTLNDGGANSIVSKINNAGVGVTATVVGNKLQLTSASTMTLGSGADTSNFLTAAKLIAAPQVTVGPNQVAESTGNLGVTKVSDYLNNARLSVALAATGTFSINGVSLNYNSATDSLNSVLTRINVSNAGVTAAYDSQTDKVVLTAKTAGSTAITLQDTAGNFLAAMNVTAPAAQTIGQTARYAIDTVAGGAWQYSSTNSISGVVPGITLNLKNTSASPVTVTVDQDTSATVKAVNDFIAQFNSVMDLIDKSTSYDVVKKKGAVLMGESTVLSAESKLRRLANSSVLGLTGSYTSLASIGITTGKIGSKVGTTDELVLDETKLTDALKSNPSAVSQVFAYLSGTVQLQGGGTGSIASITGSPSSGSTDGTYTITSDVAGNLSSVFKPDGGVALPAVTGTITAGGINNTLIPGVAITAKPVLVAGTDTLTLVFTRGVASGMDYYLNALTKTDGVFDATKKSSDAEIQRLDKRMIAIEDRLSEKQERLVKRFAALESAMSKLQSQGNQISAQLAALNQ